MSGSLLPLPVVFPLAAGALAPLLARLSIRLLTAVAVASLAASAFVLLLAAPDVYQGHILVHYLGGWGPVAGQVLGVTFGADAWGLTFALIAAVIGGLVLLFMLSEQDELGRRERGGFTGLFLLLVAALIGGGLTADLFNLFVWFEVAALASYALTAFFLERPQALSAAFTILVLTNLASFLLFLAIAFLYTSHGALNLGQLHAALAHGLAVPDRIALALLVAGFATKAGLVPFHGWLPDAHTAAPGPVSALFSGLMVNFGLVSIARIVFSVYPPGSTPVLGLLTGLGVVSAVGGALFALLQEDLKRLLAYDTISQMGVLAVGLGTGTSDGLAGAGYHLINHALFKTLLFLGAGAIVHATGATKLSEMGGVARRMPWLGAAFVLAALAIAGVPPLNGYVSIGLIHSALLDEHAYPVAVFMLLAQVLTVAALGKAVRALFRPRDGEYDRDEKLRPGMLVTLLVLGGGCLGFGLAAPWVLDGVVGPAARALSDAPVYGHALLAGGGTSPPGETPHFDYLDPIELGSVALTLLLALPAWRLCRGWQPVRALQTGSVNDYAGYLTVGLLLTVAVLSF